LRNGDLSTVRLGREPTMGLPLSSRRTAVSFTSFCRRFLVDRPKD
jgi:hypothetical protein